MVRSWAHWALHSRRVALLFQPNSHCGFHSTIALKRAHLNLIQKSVSETKVPKSSRVLRQKIQGIWLLTLPGTDEKAVNHA